MGKAYDGKKRWNETVRQTTAAAAASAADARASLKKRHSGRTVKLSKAMRSVDAETRAVVRNARLDALEADNYGGEDDALGDGADGADGDELYVDDDDNTKKQRAPKAAAGRGKPKAKSHQRRFRVKSLAQLVYEELGTGERAAAPNYLSVAAEPSKAHAPRKFCVVCGFFAPYQCRRCGSRFCRAKCGDQHHESGCLKFGL